MVEPATSRTIQIEDYDREWPRIFCRLRDRIWPCVRDVAIGGIEHVGSTSVPGLAGKPIIDIDIVVASRTDLDPLIARLAALGYEHQGNLGIEDREAFTPPEHEPAHHLYVCVQNGRALQNHLTVRDFLRSHPAEAEKYSRLKKRLAEQFPQQREHYVRGKTDFILSILGQCGFSAEALDSIRHANRAEDFSSTQ